MAFAFEAPHRNSLFDDDTHIANNGKGQTKEKKTGDHLKIYNEEPEEFPATTKNAWVNTFDLAKKINALLRPIFEDYFGSLLEIENGRMTCTLYFKPSSAPLGENSKRAFAPLGGVVSKHDNGRGKINAINQKGNRSKNFAITEYAAELLSDLVEPYCNIDPFNTATYNRITAECNSRTMMGQCIYCTVNNISIVRLLGLLYGVKDKETNSFNKYQIIPQRPIDLNTKNLKSANWLCLITVLPEAKLNKMLQTSGYLPIHGDIPAISEID